MNHEENNSGSEEESLEFRQKDDTLARVKPPKVKVPKPSPEYATKIEKPKRERTEKQKEATRKMLENLGKRRETMKKQQEEEAEMLKAEKNELKLQAKQREQYEKAKYQKKKLPPPSERPPYITAAELQQFKLEMLDIMKPQKIKVEKEIEVEKVVEKPVVVEKVKVVEKPTTKVISGNELLDRIFFSK